jgi:alkyl sulfatase BDS1-like metallo-beta-lactamase superfamily hydrolase
VLRYLSLDWIDALGEEVDRSDALKEAAVGRRITVTQIVTDGPEGDVTYHLAVDDGAVHFGPGPADGEQVRFVQDWDTAVAVATGTMNAQEAFISGRIKLIGDQQQILDAVPVFAALDTVFSSVRERTDYA